MHLTKYLQNKMVFIVEIALVGFAFYTYVHTVEINLTRCYAATNAGVFASRLRRNTIVTAANRSDLDEPSESISKTKTRQMN